MYVGLPLLCNMPFIPLCTPARSDIIEPIMPPGRPLVSSNELISLLLLSMNSPIHSSMNSCVRLRTFMYAFMLISGTMKPASFNMACTLMISGCTFPQDKGSTAVSMMSQPFLQTSSIDAIDNPGPLWPWYCIIISGCLSLMAFTRRPRKSGRPMPAISFKQISVAPASISSSAILL